MRKPVRVRKPWGEFTQYALNERVTVKLITVEPGQALSLQSHRMRDELWVPLDDGAAVRVGDRELRPRAGEEVRIPKGALHRLEAGDKRVRVLEVSFGHFDENDITRYEDRYGRA